MLHSHCSEVEDAVGEVRQSLIASHEARVQMPLSAVEIEAYILQLGRIVSSLSAAEQRLFSLDVASSNGSNACSEAGKPLNGQRRGEPDAAQQPKASLAARCKDLWVSEMEIIVEEERCDLKD